MKSDETQIAAHSLTLNEEPLFPATLAESGTHEHRLPDGTVVRAIVENSRIVGYTAHDAYKNPLQVVRLRMSEGSPEASNAKPDVARVECYYCICSPDGCQCWPESCPIV